MDAAENYRGELPGTIRVEVEGSGGVLIGDRRLRHVDRTKNSAVDDWPPIEHLKLVVRQGLSKALRYTHPATRAD
jgi:hypothetical protein